MENTLQEGDRVLVDKLTPWFGSEPERGDVVVFHDPGGWLADEQTAKKHDPVVVKQVKEGLTFIGLLPSDNEKDLIKRVIGVGGDHVKCCDAQGRVTVNGVPLTEGDYLYPGNNPSSTPFDITVPKGRLWVMGDHRDNSADSRAHQNTPYGGTVSEDSVVGRAMVIGWPVGHWTSLDEPKTFASVANSVSGSSAAPPLSHRVASDDPNGYIQLPTPAELPLVMGVVGLRLVWRRRQRGVRSGCGGPGGRCADRTRRARGRGHPSEFCGRGGDRKQGPTGRWRWRRRR
jgi:signal peptidase I